MVRNFWHRGGFGEASPELKLDGQGRVTQTRSGQRVPGGGTENGTEAHGLAGVRDTVCTHTGSAGECRTAGEAAGL